MASVITKTSFIFIFFTFSCVSKNAEREYEVRCFHLYNEFSGVEYYFSDTLYQESPKGTISDSAISMRYYEIDIILSEIEQIEDVSIEIDSITTLMLEKHYKVVLNNEITDLLMYTIVYNLFGGVSLSSLNFF